MRLRVAARTDVGRVRELNEDVYLVRTEQRLFVVCDGMGGAPAGEIASDMAVKAILERLNGPASANARGSEDGRGYLQQTSRLGEAVRRSNQIIYDEAQRDPRHTGMGTTVVGAWITEHIASVAHVGDSRAYLWHNHHFEALTRDHSLVEAQARAGLLDSSRTTASEHQNILLRVLGREPDVEVELNEVPVQPGDYLLLCSDGLTRMVPEQTVAEAIVRLRDPQRICDYLIDAANGNGGADNVTFVVIEVAGSWWRRLSNHWRRPLRGAHNAQADTTV
jgi:serine/threonine protein phosphatase PrpC